MLFTDTDSFTENVYEEFFKWKDLFDFSNYFSGTNKKGIGKMKDEFGGFIVIELVGLKSKMYSIKKLIVKNVIQQKE